MKTEYWKANWAAPLVGIAVVGGSLLAATTYVNLEQQTSAAQAISVTLDRLRNDQRLSTALKCLHEGQLNDAAQRLDLLLCQDVLRLNSQLDSADPQTRAYVNDAFRRIALLRPKVVPETVGQEYSEDQATAERILSLAAGGGQIAQTK